MPEKIYEEVEILKKHFSGKYEFLELIGKGGFALVYKVRDLYLERLGAIKILYKEYSRDEETIERFRREAKIYANLEHPNIVPIYDIGIVEGIVFFIMKFIEGETLNKIIRREGKLYEKRAIKIMSDLLDALAYIHKKGIIHRDIKPHNIMIDKYDRTILADFGIARTLESTSFTKSGAILGTAYYLSPEQAKGLPIDHRVDIYSSGVTLYEMVTGELPFKGENTLMVLYQHVNELPPLPSKFNPKISPEMENVILKALEKDPNKRFSCAEEMKEALQKIPLEPKKVVQPEPLETISIPEEEILKKVTPKKEESLEFKKFKTVPSYAEAVEKRNKAPLFIFVPVIVLAILIISLITIPPLRTSIMGIFSQKEAPQTQIQKTEMEEPKKEIEKTETKPSIQPSLEKKLPEEKPKEEKAGLKEGTPEVKKEEQGKKQKVEKEKPAETKKEEITPSISEKQKEETKPITPPPPISSTKGAIVISSSHPCSVLIDSKYRYELPPRQSIELPEGRHIIEFSIEGYESKIYDVEIVKGMVYTLHHKFTPFGKLLVNVFPWGNVKIDGKDYGPSPVEVLLQEGSHSVVVERNGFKTLNKLVNIVNGKTEKLNLNLEKK